MFYGKAVQYAENGIVRDAIVFHEHFGLESHQGEGGEPLAHLVFPDPAKENLNLADPMAKMVIRHDVAHASHEFTEEEAKRFGEVFGGGRYHESRNPLDVVAEVAAAKAARLEAAKTAAEEAAKPKETGGEQGTGEDLGKGTSSVN